MSYLGSANSIGSCENCKCVAATVPARRCLAGTALCCMHVRAVHSKAPQTVHGATVWSRQTTWWCMNSDAMPKDGSYKLEPSNIFIFTEQHLAGTANSCRQCLTCNRPSANQGIRAEHERAASRATQQKAYQQLSSARCIQQAAPGQHQTQGAKVAACHAAHKTSCRFGQDLGKLKAMPNTSVKTGGGHYNTPNNRLSTLGAAYHVAHTSTVVGHCMSRALRSQQSHCQAVQSSTWHAHCCT
jgi:hypothetical protein